MVRPSDKDHVSKVLRNQARRDFTNSGGFSVDTAGKSAFSGRVDIVRRAG